MLRRSLRDLAPLLALWIAVGAYYVFVVSAGDSPPWYVWSAHYDQQADAFRAGHLHLLESPPRALTTLKDPYDIANMPHWRWDYVYYHKRLYFYFGLVPAFIAAAVKVALGGAFVPDNALTFAFLLVRLVAGTLLIRQVARRAVPQPPGWAVWLAMLVFALANPTPFTLARAAVYEAAISGGVAFIMLGLLLGYRSLYAQGERGALAFLAAASFCFGLAGGSRLSLIPTGTALAALTGFWFWRWWRGAGKPRLPSIALAALAPAGAVTGALLIINYMRFGAWTEFGRRYVMTFPQLFLSPRFLLPDVYTYAFAPPRLGCVFPYLTSPWDALRVSAPAWPPLSWPADLYVAEPTLGMLVVAPFTWLALAAPIIAIARWRLRRETESLPTGAWMTMRLTPRTWLPTALAVCLAGAAPLLMLDMTTMRYEHDFASVVLLLAIVGGWRLLAAPASQAGRRAAAWLFGLLAAATIVAGVLLGFTGYFNHFERNNPRLLHVLQRHLDLCGKRHAR